MESDDYYKKMGFMCGLEIHQRLMTDEKLFCSCNALIGPNDPEVKRVERRQRAVAGELGKVDRSAEFEEGRERSFTYRVFRNSSCLVDIDEEPPHEMNTGALMTTVALAHSMGMKIVDEFQPMRKAVVDGSDPSAFQRTVMVALDGKIKVNGIEIAIPSLFLEEESSGIAESNNETVTYDTNRLGVPLIEIDTDPTIPNPKAAKEVALYIGTLLRITGKVQRGIGSIRQDVNMSIKGGARVEIKGVQELALMDQFLENEIRRQQELLKIKDELKKRGAFVTGPVDVTPAFKGTKAKILSSAECVMGFRLKGFGGLLGIEINPDRRLGSEISDYAKMAGVKGLIHSDEDMERYGIGRPEIDALSKSLGLAEGDAFILIAGEIDRAMRAAVLAVWRADQAMHGIPKETRAAIGGDMCTSRFMRPLPGGSRMYPETDVRPILLTSDMSKAAKAAAPNLEKENAFIRSKIKNAPLAEQMILSPRLSLFKDVIKKTKVDPEFAANFLLQKMTELRRGGYKVDGIEDARLIEAFKAYSDESITKNGLEELVKSLSRQDAEIEGLVEQLRLRRIRGAELKALAAKELKAVGRDGAVGAIMSKHRLVVDGTELNAILSKLSKR